MSVSENRIAHLGVLKAGETERMLDGDGRGWVYEIDGRIVAFTIGDLSGRNVYALFVQQGFERLGIGRQLHDTLLDWFFAADVGPVWLSTERGTRAERFYRRAGWTERGTTASGEIRFEMSREDWLIRRTAANPPGRQ